MASPRSRSSKGRGRVSFSREPSSAWGECLRSDTAHLAVIRHAEGTKRTPVVQDTACMRHRARACLRSQSNPGRITIVQNGLESSTLQYSPAQIAAHHELLATVSTGMHPVGRTQRMGKRAEGFVAGRGTFHAVCQPWLCSYYADRACDGMSAESSACHSARAQAPHRQRRRSYRSVPLHGWRCCESALSVDRGRRDALRRCTSA
jgi:hypothetical protein